MHHKAIFRGLLLLQCYSRKRIQDVHLPVSSDESDSEELALDAVNTHHALSVISAARKSRYHEYHDFGHVTWS